MMVPGVVALAAIVEGMAARHHGEAVVQRRAELEACRLRFRLRRRESQRQYGDGQGGCHGLHTITPKNTSAASRSREAKRVKAGSRSARGFVIFRQVPIGYKRAVLQGMDMKRAFVAALVLLAFSQAAMASANLDCSAKDGNVAKLEIEALTSRDGKHLARFRGVLEIEPGKTIELSSADLKSHHSEKNIAFVIAKRTPQGALEIRIFAKPVDDGDLDYEGNYVVTAGKLKKTGKIACQTG